MSIAAAKFKGKVIKNRILVTKVVKLFLVKGRFDITEADRTTPDNPYGYQINALYEVNRNRWVIRTSGGTTLVNVFIRDNEELAQVIMEASAVIFRDRVFEITEREVSASDLNPIVTLTLKATGELAKLNVSGNTTTISQGYAFPEYPLAA